MSNGSDMSSRVETPGGITITRGYRRYALGVLTLAYVSSHVDRNIMGIVIEPLKQDLGLSDTQLGFLSGIAFALFYATLGIPIAIWADRSNRRNIIAMAVTVWSAMTALCGLAGNFWQLAAARIGVGIGEAGSSPPSHSMIADLFPKDQRSGAMAIYSLGVYIGIMTGFVVGGWIVDTWGWRAAFFALGLPGLIIAALVRFTMVEPPRGHADGTASAAAKSGSLSDAFSYLWRTKSARHIILGVTLTSFVGYGGVTWAPAFLIRSYGMTPGEAGLFLGIVVGPIGGAGALLGGYLADRLAKRDLRWNAWIVAVAKLLAIPFVAGFYLAPNLSWALAFYIPGTIFGAFYLGPSFALIQTLSPLHMRALASAIMLLIINLIGLGLGPQLVGLLSDILRPSLGGESLRYALLIFAMVNIVAALHYYLGGRSLREDLVKLDEQG